MSHFTHIELECVSCRAGIKLTVIDSWHEPLTPARLRVAINELLVDHGWLPTPQGPYCHVHAVQLAAR